MARAAFVFPGTLGAVCGHFSLLEPGSASSIEMVKLKNTEQPCDKELPSLTGCKHTTEYAQTMSKYLLMNFNKQNLRFLLAVGSYYLHRFEAA